MKNNMMALALVLLAGCKTTEGALAKGPNETIHSSKSVPEVVLCLASKNVATPIAGPDGEQIVQIKSGYQGLLAVIKVKPEGQGSVVEFYKASAIGVVRWKSCAE